MQQIFLDAVGIPAKDLYELFCLVILAPLIFAFGMILFYKHLDRLSNNR
jgi:hypothetical protein